MNECIFCKISQGEIPCYKLFEDDNFLAFLDLKPTNKGHTLLIPKEHHRWVWEIEEDYSKPARRVANALRGSMGTDLVVSFVIGQDVPHAHMHLVPRYEGDEHGRFINRDIVKSFSKEEMEAIAEKIKTELR